MLEQMSLFTDDQAHRRTFKHCASRVKQPTRAQHVLSAHG